MAVNHTKDYELVQHWIEGSDGAGQKLVEESYDTVWAWVASKVPLTVENRENLIAEVVQEAFARALERGIKYDGSSSFRTWVCAIASLCLKEKWRELKRNYAGELADEHLHLLPTILEYFGDPEEIYLRKEEREALLQSIAALPTHYQDIIQWKIYDEMSFAEIHELTGRTVDALKSLFRRAIKALAEEFYARY